MTCAIPRRGPCQLDCKFIHCLQQQYLKEFAMRLHDQYRQTYRPGQVLTLPHWIRRIWGWL